jgi:hypothetical protein
VKVGPRAHGADFAAAKKTRGPAVGKGGAADASPSTPLLLPLITRAPPRARHENTSAASLVKYSKLLD